MRFIFIVARILIVLLIIRMVVVWISGLRRPARQRRPPTMAERTGGTLVRDPHCGTYVPESRAIAEGSLRFCSTTCRDAWAMSRGQRVS